MDDNSFFFLFMLVEFGLGMSMAQQMVQMMNQTMSQMHVPGSIHTMPAPPVQTIYFAIDGNQVGPVTESEVARLVDEKKVTKDTLAWMPGMAGWKTVGQIPEILKSIALTPPPIPSKS